MNWKDASVDRVVCECSGVKKKDIILAIVAGARSIEDLQSKTGACVPVCLKRSESGQQSCKTDLSEMLVFYSNIVDQLRRRKV